MSNIKNLETILHLENLVSQADENTLVLFDIGDVLLIPIDALLQGQSKVAREQLRAEYLAPLGKEQHEYLWSLIICKEKRRLVEAQAPQIIKNLQNNGVKVMALTALQTGRVGTIESMEDWRLGNLSAQEINFTRLYQDKDHFVLDELCEDGFSPVYKNGALFTYKQSKGLALTAFLKRVAFQPKQIVFVDDKLANIKDVQTAVEKLGIPYIGAHYELAKNLNKPFDEKLARFRFKYLVENEFWLTEEEAQEKLNI